MGVVNILHIKEGTNLANTFYLLFGRTLKEALFPRHHSKIDELHSKKKNKEEHLKLFVSLSLIVYDPNTTLHFINKKYFIPKMDCFNYKKYFIPMS